MHRATTVALLIGRLVELLDTKYHRVTQADSIVLDISTQYG